MYCTYSWQPDDISNPMLNNPWHGSKKYSTGFRKCLMERLTLQFIQPDRPPLRAVASCRKLKKTPSKPHLKGVAVRNVVTPITRASHYLC